MNDEGRTIERYTVVGIYDEPFGQRFAGHFGAFSPEEAERAATSAHEGLIVAGVFEGHLEAVDTDRLFR